MNQLSKWIGGILLVSGTAIGAGMLALPVSTGLAGFGPSIVLLLICWVFMTYTALLMLEVVLWMHEHANMISMARYTLGRGGELVSWLAYLFLLYALTTAYIAGSGPLILETIRDLTGFGLPGYLGPVPLLIIFGFFVYKGMSFVDFANRLLMVGLAVTYVLMVAFLAPHVQPTLLKHMHWPSLLLASSVVVTSFGFHIIIPSLSTYLKQDVKGMRNVILIGSFVPVVVYLLWEFLSLGIIPLNGENGLWMGYQTGANGAELLADTIGNISLGLIARSFALFAILTSFLGVSLSLSDFLADGLKIKKTRLGRVGLYLLTFVPPLVITLVDPRAFLSALEYAGAFGVIVILGIMPALMVWRGRYKLGLRGPYVAPGGKVALLLVLFISFIGIAIEVANQLGYTKSIIEISHAR